jgi:hypothetical protein
MVIADASSVPEIGLRAVEADDVRAAAAFDENIFAG